MVEPATTGISNVSLHVLDVERAMAFYQRGLGLTVKLDTGWTSDPARLDAAGIPRTASLRSVTLEVPGVMPDMSLIQFRVDGATHRTPVSFADSGTFHFAFDVDDFEATLARLKQLGSQQIADPVVIEGAGGRVSIVFLRDPDGFVVELIRRAS